MTAHRVVTEDYPADTAELMSPLAPAPHAPSIESRDIIDMNACLAGRRQIDRWFIRLVRRLGRHFPIEKGSLALYVGGRDSFRVTHVIDGLVLKTGLMLHVPVGDSVIYQVFSQGFPVIDNFPEHLAVSLVERKILLSSLTRSVLFVPLECDGQRFGVLSLSSGTENAFHPYLEGTGADPVVYFSRQLGGLLLAVEPTAV